jgi:hypothetical protein
MRFRPAQGREQIITGFASSAIPLPEPTGMGAWVSSVIALASLARERTISLWLPRENPGSLGGLHAPIASKGRFRTPP